MAVKEVIQVENVHFRYHEDGEDVVKGVSFSVYEGEWLAIVGHNGSGKSTLAKLINGLLLPNQGQVLVDGYSSQHEEALWDIRRRVGVVFQNPDNQFVGTTVLDDVAFGLENMGVPREEMVERIHESLQKVQMTDFLDHEPHRLSGGQKQRVAIAGVIALKPLVMILDEATSMLDPKGRKEVIRVVRELNRTERITVISITHDLDEALTADRMIVMKEGELALEGKPSSLFKNHGDFLKHCGLDLPFVIQLKKKLAEEGIILSDDALTQEDLVKELWTLK